MVLARFDTDACSQIQISVDKMMDEWTFVCLSWQLYLPCIIVKLYKYGFFFLLKESIFCLLTNCYMSFDINEACLDDFNIYNCTITIIIHVY